MGLKIPIIVIIYLYYKDMFMVYLKIAMEKLKSIIEYTNKEYINI
jgi:hypothetical protein